MKEDIIKIENLSRSFKDVKAVDNLTFKVKKGELFAFLGVNGAGKSTTINMICGQLKPDGGSIVINGRNPDRYREEVKRDIGVVFQGSVLDSPLTVLDNLKSRAALYGIHGKAFDRRLSELSAMFDLDEILRRPVGKLSGGQRRRTDIARALIHMPRILILDEPTTGLDPHTRRNLWNAISSLRKSEGMTVLLTTHYMEEAADADFVVIIDRGVKVAEGTPLQLKNAYAGDFITIYGVKREEAAMLGIEKYEEIRDGYRISVPDTSEATRLIVRYPDIFTDYEITKGRMDDVFLSVTGKSLAEGGDEE